MVFFDFLFNFDLLGLDSCELLLEGFKVGFVSFNVLVDLGFNSCKLLETVLVLLFLRERVMNRVLSVVVQSGLMVRMRGNVVRVVCHMLVRSVEDVLNFSVQNVIGGHVVVRVVHLLLGE